MSDLYRFDVDYQDEERGIQRFPCKDGDYVLAEAALKLQATITELTTDLQTLWQLDNYSDDHNESRDILAKYALKEKTDE